MRIRLLATFGVLYLAASTAAGGRFLVRDGRARADIVVAENASRTALLAARELQRYVQKISGARLAITHRPAGNRVAVFVGRSRHTDKLGITPKGLPHGACRIVSGDAWLVLIGDDTEFTPIEPWARSNAHWRSGKVLAAWDAITGERWGNPMSRMYKNYTGRAREAGRPRPAPGDAGPVHVWAFDERGSFNAVCSFLRGLGVRWYMPGELGEVVPERTTIPLPEIDCTLRPAFPIRRFYIRFGVHGRDSAMWAMRLGTRDPYGFQIAHGLHTMTHRKAVRDAHPEFYALYGGRRDNADGQRLNQLCYSSDALFRETLRYVRTMFDHYKYDVVSVMPPDGYTRMCECELCKGKDTPERGPRGRLSDYVWGYVNRVAGEIARTHPDKKVLNAAYGAYKLPPLKIARLHPNVQVCIVGGRRIQEADPKGRREVRELVKAWLARTDNPIVNFENYPFTARGWYLPTYVPHLIGRSVNRLKGKSLGEDVWFSPGKGFHAPGFNHFHMYFTARMLWEPDVRPLFDEYCRLFYGPAGARMKAFFEYCEANWQAMASDKAPADRALELFDAARAEADPASTCARRLALVGDYLDGLRSKARQLGRPRADGPELRMARDAAGITIDGKLDEPFWQNVFSRATGRLAELQTGRRPLFGTTFRAAWGNDGSAYFAVRCRDRTGPTVNVATRRNDDPAIWGGDVVEILLETESHAYYQIAVNPAGAVADLDRGAAGRKDFRWQSQAEVATHVGEDFWTVEIRIPVVARTDDPLHQVVGRKPTAGLPWYFNLCRQRKRDSGVEHSAFSPTGRASFHVPRAFAKLYVK